MANTPITFSSDPSAACALIDESTMYTIEENCQRFGYARRFGLLALARSRDQLSAGFLIDDGAVNALIESIEGLIAYREHLQELCGIIEQAEMRWLLAVEDADVLQGVES